jgi:winged helix DNA-binding protein
VPERVLSERALNRALLPRQMLLERRTGRLPDAVDRLGGLQTQYAPSGYIGLWSRLEGFGRADLTGALERRAIVQGTIMRSTIHMVSAADYPLLVAGVRDARRDWWLKARRNRIEAATVAEAAARARELLADGPLRRAELVRRLGVTSELWNGIGLWVDLLRAPPSGTWEQRRADLYVAADDWLGPVDPGRDAGIEQLVRRYLTGFGPASVRDIASWAGLPPAAVKPVAERVAPRRFRDEAGGTLVDLPRAPIPDADTPAPVRFLGTWDAMLLVHARRTGVLPERFRPILFNTKTPQSLPTFLVDGRVAGSWRYADGRVATTAFEPLLPAAEREVADEAERLAAFMS